MTQLGFNFNDGTLSCSSRTRRAGGHVGPHHHMLEEEITQLLRNFLKWDKSSD
jgi:hypothetical protein